jgi:Ser/Thr protein kinase RdoA (MazF antagonist)
MNQLPGQLFKTLGVDNQSSVQSLPGNENENYLIKAGKKSFVVKKLRGHSTANTELESVYRDYLVGSGLPAVPYMSLSGGSCVLTLGKDSYVAMSYQDGRMAIPNKRVLIEAGGLLAKVHSLDAAIMPTRQSWYRKSYIPDALGLIDDKFSDTKKAFTSQYSSTPDFWGGDLPAGIIHGDLQGDNLIVDAQDKIVSIIDWEEVAVEPLLLDIAHSAQQLSFERGVCDQELFDAFIGAYQSTRSLTTSEKLLFDAALRYTMLVLSVWAHIKVSRGQMDDDSFYRIGNYYRASYIIPRVG